MGALLALLLKEHGGKTMTGGVLTVALLMWTGMEAGVVPVPASRGYVDQAIITGTKGLDYLVKQAIEADVDLAAYEVQCMNERWKQGQLERLKEQYRELVGAPYADKECSELERRVQTARGIAQ